MAVGQFRRYLGPGGPAAVQPNEDGGNVLRWGHVNIPATEIQRYLPEDTYEFQVFTEGHTPFKVVSLEELLILVEANRVRARVRGSRIDRITLTVPPDVAGRDLGETRQRIKEMFHSAANDTTQRSEDTLPKAQKKHHGAHCNAFLGPRHILPPIPGYFIVDRSRLTSQESALLLDRSREPLRPPLATEQ